MRTSDFDYELPDALIARHPAAQREDARLLVTHRHNGAQQHLTFRQLPEVLSGDELLVVNDTRVLPARLFGRRKPTGGRVELLLVRPAEEPHSHRWVAMGRSNRPLKPGAVVELTDCATAEVCERHADGSLTLEFSDLPTESVSGYLKAHGQLPLPPYLRRDPVAEDRIRYQTVYAAEDGAVAAPTAGLHFSAELLDTLRAKGCELASLTLHVGPGTFRPVSVDDPREHRLDPERYEIPVATSQAVARAKAEGRRVLAVGTTVVRALEHAAAGSLDATLPAGSGQADLLIMPGYRLRVVDCLLTNFHLPRSSLLMLVAAFHDRRSLLETYRNAVSRGYRFYSYGDSTLWL